MKKVFIGLWIALISFALLFAITFRLNTKSAIINSSAMEDYSIQSYEAQEKQEDIISEQDIKYDNFDELYDNSEVVVKFVPDYEKSIKENNILCFGQVKEVYKGELENNYIEIIEPITLQENEMMIFNKNYNYMKEGKEYILFLDKRQFVEGLNKEEQAFILTDELYGKYSFSETDGLVSENVDGYKYSEIVDYSILTLNEEILKRYVEIKKQVEEMYNK